MKTQIVFTCCRCGREQVDNLTRFGVHKFKYKELVVQKDNAKTMQYELCSDCLSSLKTWLRNGDEYKELIEENKDLMTQRDRLNNMRIELGNKLRDVESDFRSCKCFCPKESPSYNEYLEWCKKQN